MIKKNKTKCLYNGERLNVKEIYRRNKKRRGHSRYLLSVSVMIEKDDEIIPAKLVFVRNKSNRKDWLTITSADTIFRRIDYPYLWKTSEHRSLFQSV